jgi:hypothetical protein
LLRPLPILTLDKPVYHIPEQWAIFVRAVFVTYAGVWNLHVLDGRFYLTQTAAQR